jgi:hypothetical protein
MWLSGPGGLAGALCMEEIGCRELPSERANRQRQLIRVYPAAWL